MHGQGLDQLVFDGVDGIEAGSRILEDHRDVATSDLAHLALAQRRQVLIAEHDRAGSDRTRRFQELQNRKRGHALARSRLTDQGHRLALIDPEAHIANSFNLA